MQKKSKNKIVSKEEPVEESKEESKDGNCKRLHREAEIQSSSHESLVSHEKSKRQKTEECTEKKSLDKFKELSDHFR